jgi:hypothetical protein
MLYAIISACCPTRCSSLRVRQLTCVYVDSSNCRTFQDLDLECRIDTKLEDWIPNTRIFKIMLPWPTQTTPRRVQPAPTPDPTTSPVNHTHFEDEDIPSLECRPPFPFTPELARPLPAAAAAAAAAASFFASWGKSDLLLGFLPKSFHNNDDPAPAKPKNTPSA